MIRIAAAAAFLIACTEPPPITAADLKPEVARWKEATGCLLSPDEYAATDPGGDAVDVYEGPWLAVSALEIKVKVGMQVHQVDKYVCVERCTTVLIIVGGLAIGQTQCSSVCGAAVARPSWTDATGCMLTPEAFYALGTAAKPAWSSDSLMLDGSGDIIRSSETCNDERCCTTTTHETAATPPIATSASTCLAH